MKNKKQLLRARADKLWYSKYTKSYCEVCGSTKFVVGHHFYFKGSYGHLRYDKNNCVSLCRKCHFILHFRGDPSINIKIVEVRGKKWYNRLTKKAKNRPKSSYLTLAYYEDIFKKLSNKSNEQRTKKM